MNDTFIQKARQQLVEILRSKGITDASVLTAINKLPRHLFVEPAMAHKAYDDTALPIGMNQTISQPYTVAYMTEQLHVKAGMKVLEIGTGSGYQAAVLATMGARVFTIERHHELHLKSRQLLESMNYQVVFRFGDGTLGWSQYAPYDGIIVTAGGPTVPPTLKKQLSLGGRMVIPIGDEKIQRLEIITRTGDETFDTATKDGFKFVPLIGHSGWKG